MSILRVDSVQLTEDFCRWANTQQAPLPWRLDDNGTVMDANGQVVLFIAPCLGDADELATLIIVAVNTCGGFKAERADA